VFRKSVALVALLLLVSLPAPVLGASGVSGDSARAECPASVDAAVLGSTPSTPGSATDLTMGRAPNPIQVLPGAQSPFVDLPIVSETVQTSIEGGLTHTTRTTIRSGLPPGSVLKTNGGRLASPSTCTFLNQNSIQQDDTICGGGCLTQSMVRSFNKYSNTNGLNYFGRVQVRLWWTRQYDVQIYFTGSAYTEWDEGNAYDCSGSWNGRTVSNSFAPSWNTWDRTYDYYWDETWLPIVTPTFAGPELNVWTSTPESYGPNLYTIIQLQ
jgi:hypothetical protein